MYRMNDVEYVEYGGDETGREEEIVYKASIPRVVAISYITFNCGGTKV